MRESSIQIVKATAPVLEQIGARITTHFYGIMLTEFPEVRPLFNQAHQANGTQSHALANAIVAFANHVDNPQALSTALWRVAQKHASLFVQPEQYNIVGQCLVRAIDEVLGEAATPEILDAWADAYDYLANLLIDIEEYIYRTNEAMAGGWRGTRRFRVSRREAESDNVTSFYLEPVDGGLLPAFRPGQYITFDLEIDGQAVRRNYSLSNAPGCDYLRVSIKREPGGLVSGYFHERVDVGTELDVYPPCGEFVLDSSELPLVLVSAGVGTTPLISMLDHAIHTGRPIVYLHATQNRQAHAFREHVENLAAQHPQLCHAFIYETAEPGDEPHHTGRLSAELLSRYLPEARDQLELYFLGPKPFMQDVYQAALMLGVPEERVHFEFFGPHEQLAAPAALPHQDMSWESSGYLLH